MTNRWTMVPPPHRMAADVALGTLLADGYRRLTSNAGEAALCRREPGAPKGYFTVALPCYMVRRPP